MKPVILCFALAVLSLISISQASAADPGAPVTQEQFKAWTDWAKKSVDILDQREKKLEINPSAPAPSGGEQAVDLNAVTSTPASGTSQSTVVPGEAGAHKAPIMETYFDFNLVNQPGTSDSLAFDNYHSLVFFYINPTPDITFSFNMLGPSVYPIYYELDYQAAKRLTLRAGKIWIPFDDLSPQSPHNIFGGRVGLQALAPTTGSNGGQLYLPSLWTELGVGARYMLVDNKHVQLQTDMTLSNGFTNGGQNPVTPNGEYPGFTEYTPAPNVYNVSGNNTSSGNHRNKSIDLRGHVEVENTFGFGMSYYTGQWNPDGDSFTGGGPLFLNMIGFDAQLQLGFAELRGGISSMHVELPEGTMTRGGTYAELGVPFLKQWKAMIRGGTLQLDDRIAQPTDMTIIGGTLLFNPGTVQFSIESSRDIKNPGVAVGFVSYTDLRMIMLF